MDMRVLPLLPTLPLALLHKAAHFGVADPTNATLTTNAQR